MKKLLVIALMFAGFSQLQAQTRFGAQVNYSTSSIAGLGFGGHAEFFISDKLSIQPAFDYYLAKEIVAGSGVSNSSWLINGDAHYYFTESGSMKIYGIGGLSYLSYTAGVAVAGFSTSATASTIGVNLGAGTTFGESSTLPFVEVKFNSPLSGLVLTAGIKFGGSK